MKFKKGKKKEFYAAAAVLLVGNLFGIGMSLTEETGEKTDYLERPGYGEGSREEVLLVHTGEKEETVQLQIPEQIYTEEEATKLLKEAEEKLNAYFGEKGWDWNAVSEDLLFPGSLPESPVQLSWYTDRPEVLSWEGIIENEADQKGSAVKISCLLSLEGQERLWEKEAVIFPAKGWNSGGIQQMLQKELDKKQEEPGTALCLPQKLNGETVSYEKPGKRSGWKLCLLSTVLGLGIVPLVREKEKQREAERIRQMKRDYPDILDRLVLFLKAGLNIRNSMEKLAKDYLNMRTQYEIGEKQAYEEIVRTCREMEGGVYEAEAYDRLGKRCGLPEYKILSVLLVQNLKKGNQGLLDLLERESASASEERKRLARIRGEEAATQLLLPMMLQLIVVLIFLMVPAFLSFF